VQVQEVKQRLDGSRQVFYCDALLITDSVAVLKFTATADYTTDPSTDLPHRYTEAFFWAGRPYLLYRMYGDDNRLIGYRFDVCTDVEIRPNMVRYTDLLLDFWVSPDLETTRFMDEDEVAAAAGRGLLSADHLAIIEQARNELSANYRDVLAEARTLMSHIGSRL
jgi:hypothetical protein